MADHRLHSPLGAANYPINDVAPMRTPFVCHPLAQISGRAFETIGLGRVNSFDEMLLPPANLEFFDISVLGAHSTEARMR